MDSPTPTPTPTQLLSLTALVPAKKPRPPDVRHLLGELISVLHPPEILNYLFAAEPLHLPPLLSPTLAQNAMTFHHSITRVEPPPPIFPCPTFSVTSSHHVASSFVLAPAVTLPPLTTLGVGIMQGFYALGNQLLPLAYTRAISSCLNFRFVYDPIRPINLQVYDSPEDDSIVIFLSSNASLTLLHSFTASFRRSTLRASIRTKGDTVDADDFFTALLFIYHDKNIRKCPVCTAPQGSDCYCQIPIVKSAHPLDFLHFKNNFATLFGSYQGLATKVSAVGPMSGSNHSICLGTHTSMGGVMDHSILERLRAWAVSSHLQGIAQNPLDSVAFSRDPNLALEDSPIDWIKEELSDVEAFEPLAGGDPVVSMHLAELLADVNADVGGHTPVSMTSSRHVQEGESYIPVISQQPSTFELDPHAGKRTAGDTGLGARPDTSTINTENEHGQDVEWWGRRSRETGQQRSLDSDATALFLPQKPVELETVVDTKGMNMCGSAANDAGRASVLDRGSASGGAEDVHEILRKMRDEERKERNRVSARRSNRKKKEKGDALEAELKRVQDMADELRAKELKLREENRLLRGAFPDPG